MILSYPSVCLEISEQVREYEGLARSLKISKSQNTHVKVLACDSNKAFSWTLCSRKVPVIVLIQTKDNTFQNIFNPWDEERSNLPQIFISIMPPPPPPPPPTRKKMRHMNKKLLYRNAPSQFKYFKLFHLYKVVNWMIIYPASFEFSVVKTLFKSIKQHLFTFGPKLAITFFVQ